MDAAAPSGPFEAGGDWLGGVLGSRAGAVIGGTGGALVDGSEGAAAGTLIGPEGTFIGGVAGAGIGATTGGIAGAMTGRKVGSHVGFAVGKWLDQHLTKGDQSLCSGNCAAAEKAPGNPTDHPNSGYKPAKKWDGKKVQAANGGYGYPDANGNVWVPTGADGTPQAHGGEHWDVQSPGGGYNNVYPNGVIRPGRAPFPVL